MSIPLIITNGIGNGTFSGQISKIVTMGFAIGEPAISVPVSARYNITFSADDRTVTVSSQDRDIMFPKDNRDITL